MRIFTAWPPYKKGAFTFLYDPINGDKNMVWLNDRLSIPRTYREWSDLVSEFRTPVWNTAPHAATSGFKWKPPPYPDYKQGDYLHPYFHRDVVATLLEGWWLRNQRLRWLCRKWIHRIRIRKIAQRQHGLVDLATCEAIPVAHRVTVFDVPSRSVYHFHTATIHRALLKDLLYQRYAVPAPTAPKNPYTNLTWTLGQMCVILDQIQGNMWRSRHRFVDCVLVKFRQAAYDVAEFQRIFSKHLMFRSAVAFFKDPTNDDWEDIYIETFDDIMSYSDVSLRNNQIRNVRNYLVHRSLPKDILDLWDNLMIAYWIHENNGESLGFSTLEELYAEAARLTMQTHVWITEDRVRLRDNSIKNCVSIVNGQESGGLADYSPPR